MNKRIYSDSIIYNTPRLLGLIDRNIYSRTYGCFDRHFWHYKTIDFPGARYQEAGLTLAMLYKYKYPGNHYYNKDNIKKWAVAAIRFWADMQDNDGSFSEWYPHEHSFVATSLSSYAITETFLLLRDIICDEDINIIEESIQKACRWLSRHNDTTASSQQGGASAALYNAYLIFNDIKYRRASESKIKTLVKKNRSPEGWFAEYGGADVGYLSVFLDYLAKIYQKSGDKKLLDYISDGYRFMRYFIHPDWSFGGEYGSRNTEYIVPDGAEIISHHNTDAGSVAFASIKNLVKNGLNYDDRYFCYYGYINLQAYNNYNAKKEFRVQTTFTKLFKNAGIYVISSPRIYAIIGLKKGGVIKVFDKKTGHRIVDDCGVIGVTNNGQVISTECLDNTYKFSVSETNINISGFVHNVTSKIPSSFTTIISRSFQSTLGKNPKISLRAKRILRKKLITKDVKVPLIFNRNLKISNDRIEITDSLYKTGNISISKLGVGGKFSLIYIPSSRYFDLSEINSHHNKVCNDDILRLNHGEKISIHRTFHI